MARRTQIIAEIGENHHGAWEIAAGMIEQAAQNGADIVKFQSYLPSDFSPDDPEYDWFKRVALPNEKHFEFKETAEKLGIEFMSSPFSCERALFLCEKLKCKSIKVASGQLKNFKMLDVINSGADTVKTVYVSTGMSYIDDIKEALAHLDKIENIAVLHCVSQYPAEMKQANLKCIQTLIKEFPSYAIGYSDHVPGLQAAITAVSLGAEVIEKHFTFNHLMPGTDHICAMTPDELKVLVRQIEEIEMLLGSDEKKPTQQELQIRDNIWNRFNK